VTTPLSAREERTCDAVVIPVSGMTCTGCAGRVERAIAKAPGVVRAEVSFATRSAKVVLDDAPTHLAAALAAITSAGYEPAATLAQILARRGASARAESDRVERKQASRNAILALAIAALQMAFGMPFMAHGSHAATALAGAAMHPLLRPALLVSTLFVLWIARSFFVRAWAALRQRTADMNTLVALGSGTAFLYSAVATLLPSSFATDARPPEVHFEAASFILAFVLLGRALEGRARARTTAALDGLLALVPAVATLVRDGEELRVPASDVSIGDIFVLRPGDRAAADGVVVEGATHADEAMLTGESHRISKREGDEVHAGTIAVDGLVRVRATRVGDDTRVARIAALVQDAQGSRAPVQRLADRVAAYSAPAILLIATTSAVAWAVFGPEPRLVNALTTFVTVVVVSCPCALGLATPTAIATAIGRAAQLGILVRSGDALERAAQVDTVAIDKTGTLTEGEPELVELVVVKKTDADADEKEADEKEADAILRLAAAVERGSEHPVGRAILAEAEAREIDVPEPRSFVASAGAGARAEVEGHVVRVGAMSWLAGEGIATAGTRPEAAFGIAVDGVLRAYGLVADRLRDDAREVVTRLHALGVRVVVLTGDRQDVARAVAAELGVDDVEAELTPEGKIAVLDRLAREGRCVAMCGDGINDAPALARAHVGIAIGSATDAAIDASDVTLLAGGLAGLPDTLQLARRSMGVIRQNLAWAFVYNLALVPIAAGALVPWLGVRLPPALASAAMALSSISVVLSSLRLRRFERK
jgi:P-type Cu+ transporter